VKLISPQFVRPFVKSNKNDFVDAEAICEAVSRPSMRFVTFKNEAQQTLSALHRVRELLVRDRIKTSNQIHKATALGSELKHARERRMLTLIDVARDTGVHYGQP
jgi:transposase